MKKKAKKTDLQKKNCLKKRNLEVSFMYKQLIASTPD